MKLNDNLADSWTLPQPYRLHWIWVALLTVFTGGLFSAIWLLVICQWVERVKGKSRAYGWAWAFVVCEAFAAGSTVLTPRIDGMLGGVSLVLFLVVSFLLRDELEQNPIGLSLSGAMTFFFGPIYFQYHLQRFGDDQFRKAGKTLNV